MTDSIPTTQQPSRAARFGPWIVLALAIVYLMRAAMPPAQSPPGDFDIDGLAKLPVSFSGRVKPIDSVARNALMSVSGKRSLSAGSPMSSGQTLAPPFLSPAHEVNWPLLVSRLLSEKDQETNSVSKHLWSLMDEAQRKTLTDAKARGVMLSDEPALRDLFNELLMKPGFFKADLWPSEQFSSELRYEFNRVLSDSKDPHVSMADYVRLHRQLLSIAYGDLVRADRDKSAPAIVWLLDLIARPKFAVHYEVFRIDDPDVLAIFGWKSGVKKYFSLYEIQQRGSDFPRQFELARQIDTGDRDRFQKHVLDLASAINSVNILGDMSTLHLAPPVQAGQDWMTIQAAFQHQQASGVSPPGTRAWAEMLGAYSDAHPETFNRALNEYRAQLATLQPSAVDKAGFETLFNHFSPFTKGIFLYLVIFMLVCIAWLRWRGPLLSTAFKLLILVLILHSVALVARVYLSGRPPVTNLYSSAVFIGWGVVVLCLILERLHKNGLGTMVAAVAGVVTLIIAHNLGKDGDTMAVLQAVLDTNFWLATHVIIITLGYSATFLAGLLGIAYILRGLFTTTLSKTESKSIGQMIYGIVCFALLFSFVGTILGGIWADQSWGRFWGWDPKENGALLIVLWNALILHARWGGMVRERGMATLAVFGNVVTSWSWFGTNMLGVGLHAYGFIDSALFWMFVFVASQLTIIGLGCVPISMWRSFRSGAAVHIKRDPQINPGKPGKRVTAPIVTARS